MTLEERVEKLELLCTSLMLALWHERGAIKGIVEDKQDEVVQLKGISGKIEKELEPYFKEWREKRKSELPVKEDSYFTKGIENTET